jgi:hypothetical protein
MNRMVVMLSKGRCLHVYHVHGHALFLDLYRIHAPTGCTAVHRPPPPPPPSYIFHHSAALPAVVLDSASLQLLVLPTWYRPAAMLSAAFSFAFQYGRFPRLSLA